ncbi:MAG: HRDC domain-containing protein [Anaerolineaceae bacterium]|nr:HRDC domain-containing protein [Anaerolineaceae bacterium]
MMIPPQIVTNFSEYESMISALEGQPAIGIDTESNSLFAYREQVCLVQISIMEADFLVDPFPMDGMTELGTCLANPHMQKIFHAGDYDIACLKRDYGFAFQNLFDTMLAAATLGEKNIGLASVLEKYLGVTLDKKYQRADWGKRPIKPEMLQYAQGDSHYLIPLRDKLQEELIKAGKLDLLLEDSRNLAKIEAAVAEPMVSVWHVHGAQGLKPGQWSLLQDLVLLRESLAEKLNRPVFKILGDASLVDLAKVQPHHIEELGLLPSLSEGQVKAFGKAIMAAITEWRKNPGKLEKPKHRRPGEAELHRRDLLSGWRKEQGTKMGVSSNIVLSKDLIDKMAKENPKTSSELQALMADYPCRYALFGQDILAILQKDKE